MRAQAAQEVENAIDVSYIEHLAFGEVTDNRIQGMELMPKAIRAILLDIDGRGRWDRKLKIGALQRKELR